VQRKDYQSPYQLKRGIRPPSKKEGLLFHSLEKPRAVKSDKGGKEANERHFSPNKEKGKKGSANSAPESRKVLKRGGGNDAYHSA